MEELLKLFDKLIKTIGNARNEVTAMFDDYRKVNEELLEERNRLKEERIILNGREKKVSELENIIDIDKNNKITLKEISKQKDELVQAQNEFNKYVVDKKKEISKGLYRNEVEANDNKKEAEILNKMKIELEEEKKVYKDKIAKSIVYNIKSK